MTPPAPPGAGAPSPLPLPGPSPTGTPGSGAPAPSPAGAPSTSAYNWVYKELVTGPNDAVGAIAYALYKQDKIAFIEATIATHGQQPTDAELKVFHTQTCVPAKIDAYRTQAEQLGQAFLNAGLKQRVLAMEEEVRESVINQNVSTVLAEIKAKKTFVAWLGDMAASLGVNIATILVIGALLGGYQALARFNSVLEKLSNVPAAAEPANVAIPANPAANAAASADR
jgi:hypothetical protein